MTSFIKLAHEFKINWDVDKIVNRISKIDIPVVMNSSNIILPHSEPSGVAHWQEYPSKIAFARNFYKNFRLQCVEVSNKLRHLQSTLTADNELLEQFIAHPVVPERVNLIRTIGGQSVAVHCDTTRNICINIGLKNSDSFRTRIGNDGDITNFYNRSTQTYTMNDGDVYLISIKNAHCVEAITDTPEPRYIITYTLQ